MNRFFIEASICPENSIVIHMVLNSCNIPVVKKMCRFRPVGVMCQSEHFFDKHYKYPNGGKNAGIWRSN